MLLSGDAVCFCHLVMSDSILSSCDECFVFYLLMVESAEKYLFLLLSLFFFYISKGSWPPGIGGGGGCRGVCPGTVELLLHLLKFLEL